MQLRHPSNELCGLCQGPKVRISYNKSKDGYVVMQSVHLCDRCDLAPDPPVLIDLGEN